MSKPEEINSSSISAGNLYLNKVFSDDFEYAIPNYQRPYSWEEEQCIQLVDDIHTFAFKSGSLAELAPYFLGSIVIVKRPEDTISQIVDGQQRLTTLTILLSCLRHLIDDVDDKNDLTGLIYQKGSSLKGTKDTYRLKTRKKDQEYFKKLVQDQAGLVLLSTDPDKLRPGNDSQERMLANTHSIIKSLTTQRKYDQDQLKHLTAYIIQKCTLVVVRSTDEEMAFRIFNVLNDRGLDLSIADILKSEVIEKIPDHLEDIYTQKWEDVEESLGIEFFKSLFSHVRSIYTKKRAERAILNEIREYVKPSNDPVRFIDDVLKPFADAYIAIRQNAYFSIEDADKVNSTFRKLKRVGHNDWYPPAILFLARNANRHDEILKFFKAFDAFTIGLEAMSAPLNERIERYARIMEAIENDECLYEQPSPLLLNDLDRKRIIKNLGGTSLYRKRMLKPVLAKIEEGLSDQSITVQYESLSIEHILPQTPTHDYWRTRFSVEDQVNLTNCLGNLSLISFRKNSQAKNYPFDKKINVYFKRDQQSSNLVMVNQINTGSDWSPERIEKRKDYLISVFLKSIELHVKEFV